MRVPRIFVEQALASGVEIALGADASHHLIRVLRMVAGRPLTLFNGDGKEYSATLNRIERKIAHAVVGEGTYLPNTSPLVTELAIALSKGERFDWVLQKSVELGVSKVIPLLSERTDVRLSDERICKKQQSWLKIIRSACEQCHRNVLPALEKPISAVDYIQQCGAQTRFVLHHRGDGTIDHNKKKPASVSLLIGPEGGLTEQEITAAQAHGFTVVSLGPRVLRTETAPLATLAIIQHLWGDF